MGRICLRLREQVGAFISKRSPKPVCDACVADHLALSRRQVVAAGGKLRRDRRFYRFSGRCSCCCTDRRVTMLPEG